MDTYRAHKTCGSWPTYTDILHATQRERESTRRGNETWREREVSDAVRTKDLDTRTHIDHKLIKGKDSRVELTVL